MAAGWVWLLQVPVATGQGVSLVVTSGLSGRWAGVVTSGPSGRWAGVVTSGPSGRWAGCSYFRSQWPLGRVFPLWLLQVPVAAGQGVSPVVTSGPSGCWAGCFPCGHFRSQWLLGRV